MKKLLFAGILAITAVQGTYAADDNCSYCVDALNNGEGITSIVCNAMLSNAPHRFHTDCIAADPRRPLLCPLCRHDFDGGQIQTIKDDWLSLHAGSTKNYVDYGIYAAAAAWFLYGGKQLIDENKFSSTPQPAPTDFLGQVREKTWVHYKAMASAVGYVCGGWMIAGAYELQAIMQRLAYENARFNKRAQDPQVLEATYQAFLEQYQKNRALQIENVRKMNLFIGHTACTVAAVLGLKHLNKLHFGAQDIPKPAIFN